MKTIEESAKEYALKTDKANLEWVMDDFKAGVEFAQRWISVDEELPETHKFVVLVKIRTYNGEKIEVAFYLKDTNTWFTTASCYHISQVTHWRPIEVK